MERIDIVKLRKFAGMSQRELADKLQVRPSFLSAIENGRSRIPEEKVEKLREIFDVDNFDGFMIDDKEEAIVIPPHTHPIDEGNAIAKLLQHIHAQAHHNDEISGRSEELEQRIDFLSNRNDRLSDRVDSLREEVDRLRGENFRLKELLLKNNISY